MYIQKQINIMEKEKKYKTLGQVFTPGWIVSSILDFVGYSNESILNKKIIEPACGDGAFLLEIVKRFIKQANIKGLNKKEIVDLLENSIYGIEIDKEEYKKCISNLNNLVSNLLGVESLNWKIYNDNTLILYKQFLGQFDYVVGNPPYIRIHNLDNETRQIIKQNFVFSKGTIDIYVTFFELGFKLLNKNGILGYITPNSYLHNSSYKGFRDYIKMTKSLKILVDFKSNKVFDNFSTYTAISIFDFKTKNDYINYKELKDGKIVDINKIYYSDIQDNWSFSASENMKKINISKNNFNKKIEDFFNVQYGFATLRDKIYIGDIQEEKDNLALFNGFWVEKEILQKIVKGSTYKGTKKEIKYILFPYKKLNDKVVPLKEDELKNNYPNAYKYLLVNKEELLKRDLSKGTNWYEFGRNQGLNNSFKEKIVVSTLIKDKLNYYFLDKDIFVYSGIFITKQNNNVSWDILKEVLNSKDFLDYVLLVGKNFSGGYKGLTSKIIKHYPTNIKNEERLLFV